MIVVKAIVITVAVLGGLGLVFGLILALASKLFAVQVDPRKELLMEVMPGANCGACGFAGCSAYADAVISGASVVGACPVGGAEVAKKMASIMGTADVGAAVRQVAMVRCNGNGSNRSLYQYEGIADCLAASRVAAGGPLACQYGCLAYGSCMKVCDFGAITIRDGHAAVDTEKCVGCLKCISACPRGLITVVPYGSEIFVTCFSRDKGVVTRSVCDCGCIGCGLCVKACSTGAITVENNLASIVDYSKCVACGACIDKCPQHLIRRASEAREGEALFLIPEQAVNAQGQGEK
jgi:Na+-translocating ferredoxin:NAD+ oxidoreductase RNF subunit RnfB